MTALMKADATARPRATGVLTVGRPDCARTCGTVRKFTSIGSAG